MAMTTINLASLDGNTGFRLDGVAASNYLGGSVSSAGDFNGDGFTDVIVGAFGADPNGTLSGSSYVVFGKASGFDPTLDLTSLDGNNGFRLDGAAARDQAGRPVSNAGDVNGDGFSDVIVGARAADPNGRDSGSSYVVFGRASGFPATFDLSSLDGNNGFRLDGEEEFDYAGTLVSSAGDVNGDGFSDVIVGNYTSSGYIVFGKASGFAATADLSSLNGSNGFRLYGVEMYGGFSVDDAGDVNGDGFADLIVGTASETDTNGAFSGSSYVVFGKASGFAATLDFTNLDGNNGFRLDGVAAYDGAGAVSTAGDVNGDGFADVIVGARGAGTNGPASGSSYVVFGKASGFAATLDLSSLDGNNGFRLDGGAYEGSGSVSSAGDVNGDGFSDVLVGAQNADPNGILSGSSYVVFGKASGFAATLDLSNLSSDSGFRLDGVAAYDLSGSPVSGAGDVNGDGFDDLLVGASGTDHNGSRSGSSYIIFGRSEFSGSDVTHPGTPGNDNLIGRGGADVFHAGAGDDNIRVSDLNFQLVEGGTGNDSLHLAGKDLNLDLSTIGDKISGIEAICLYGRGDNTLTLTAADLINLSDTTNTLKVHGNAGDHLVGLSSGWTDGGIGLNGYFHTYTQGDAILLVGLNLTTDFV